ncbi:signal peptidase I [Microbacterium gilvum]|uniref:Signal peptidase I n=1 Tax=Microbacterium gilvum TaxID=1336204 RepID=A0ABP9AID1_9MICO
MSTTAVPATRRSRRGGGDAARPRRTAGRVLGDLLLSAAALAGTICIVLVILAAVLDITLIMFRTGSMAPTIPAGSVAVVQRIPASEIDVGEVVTVDRAGELPVTHRVTSVSAGASDEERVITMRGDANEADDVAPYTVSSARLVLFSVPGIAPVIASFGSPFVIGGMTVGAALLVGWAFWPRTARMERTVDERADAG